MSLVWCEINDWALAENARTFRALVGDDVRLAMTVKANAYGHGLVESAQAFISGGADWLCVHALDEAEILCTGGVTAPIYITGPVALEDLERVGKPNLRMVVYNLETIQALVQLGIQARLHLKIETGNYRQGIDEEAALVLAKEIAAAPNLELEGISSHFANIEDTTDHRYARQQWSVFETVVESLRSAGHEIPIRHLANSAATILWPDQALDMVRVGISGYGLWPSKETRVAASLVGRGSIELYPALTWKTRIAQVKRVPEGSYVGYGCTFKTSKESRIAILPVGYFDGYDRSISNLGHVLCHGRRAPIRGRVCMNIIMVDVTDISAADLESEVVLLGAQGDDQITAEQLADWAGTINYEMVARLGGHIPRHRSHDPQLPKASGMSYRPPQVD